MKNIQKTNEIHYCLGGPKGPEKKKKNWSLVIGPRSLVPGYWCLVIGHWSLVIGS